MDMHGMRERMYGGGGYGNSPFFIPAPMAFFGVIVSFMLGMMFGMMWGKKAMLMKMMAGKGHMRGMGGMGMHHHHGFGMGACMEKHGHKMGAWKQEGCRPAEEERNEGE